MAERRVWSPGPLTSTPDLFQSGGRRAPGRQADRRALPGAVRHPQRRQGRLREGHQRRPAEGGARVCAPGPHAPEQVARVHLFRPDRAQEEPVRPRQLPRSALHHTLTRAGEANDRGPCVRQLWQAGDPDQHDRGDRCGPHGRRRGASEHRARLPRHPQGAVPSASTSTPHGPMT